MLHLVFNEPEVALLHEVIGLDPTLEGPVELIRDDFAVGPLDELGTPEGKERRKQWWKQLLSGSPYGTERADQIDDDATVLSIKKYLDQEDSNECWIWMGQNQHDVSGYYWLTSQLRAYQGRVLILYMNNLPFLNEKGQLFYPSFLSEIRPAEFLKAKKLARPITLSEFEIDPDEWTKLCNENGLVRWLEGGKKLVSKEISCYDQEIRRFVGGDWQKSTRLLNQLHLRMKNRTGDVFLMSRLRSLVEAGVLELKGEPGGPWKELEFRQPGAFGSKDESATVEP
ncbi:MAG: DUF1835 domain-containing protein [Sphingomonadales bacterium]|nr:DUF1835 domain-containing protein [Sphingomonadales bacterium]